MPSKTGTQTPSLSEWRTALTEGFRVFMARNPGETLEDFCIVAAPGREPPDALTQAWPKLELPDAECGCEIELVRVSDPTHPFHSGRPAIEFAGGLFAIFAHPGDPGEVRILIHEDPAAGGTREISFKEDDVGFRKERPKDADVLRAMAGSDRPAPLPTVSELAGRAAP